MKKIQYFGDPNLRRVEKTVPKRYFRLDTKLILSKTIGYSTQTNTTHYIIVESTLTAETGFRSGESMDIRPRSP